MRNKRFDLSTLRIESGIPIPRKETRQAPNDWIGLLRKMKVGKSFVVPTRSLSATAFGAAKRAGIAVTTQALPNGTYRVWRTRRKRSRNGSTSVTAD